MGSKGPRKTRKREKSTSDEPKRRYRETTFDMGVPRVDLRKSLGLAAAMEDEEIRQKLARGK
jgi:hypothetical protein